jgi:hypothetical protein
LQSGAESEGPLFHRLADHLAHLLEFRGSGRTIVRTHNEAANAPGPHKGAEVDGRFCALEMAEVIGQRGPVESHAKPLGGIFAVLPHEIVHRGDRGAFAGDFRCHPLRDFTGRAIVDQNIEFGLALDVNETGSSNKPSGVHPFGGGGLLEISDSRDTVVDNPDVPDEPGRTAAVHNASARQNEIVVRWLAEVHASQE